MRPVPHVTSMQVSTIRVGPFPRRENSAGAFMRRSARDDRCAHGLRTKRSKVCKRLRRVPGHKPLPIYRQDRLRSDPRQGVPREHTYFPNHELDRSFSTSCGEPASCSSTHAYNVFGDRERHASPHNRTGRASTQLCTLTGVRYNTKVGTTDPITSHFRLTCTCGSLPPSTTSRPVGFP